MAAPLSFGVGFDAKLQLGLPVKVISERVAQQGLPSDGAATKIDIKFPISGRLIRLYVRRQGDQVDIGTRVDFESIVGWKLICDEIDRQTAVPCG